MISQQRIKEIALNRINEEGRLTLVAEDLVYVMEKALAEQQMHMVKSKLTKAKEPNRKDNINLHKIAVLAMQGMLASDIGNLVSPKELAKAAYTQAEAMVAEGKKPLIFGGGGGGGKKT